MVESWQRQRIRLKQLSRVAIANYLVTFAGFSLAFAILLAPSRWRWVLIQRDQPPLYPDYTDLLFYGFELLLIVTLLLWFGSLMLRPRPLSPGVLGVTLPLTGIWGAGAWSVLFSVDRLNSFYQFLSGLILIGIYLFVINEIRDFRKLTWAIAVGLVGHASLASGQVLRQGSFGLSWLGERNLALNQMELSKISVQGVENLRAYGLADHPNILGGMLVTLLLWLVCILLARAEWNLVTVLLVSIILNGATGLVFTYSRSAWLAFGFAVLTLVWGLWANKRPKQLVQMVWLLGAIGIILIPLIVSKFSLLREALLPGSTFDTTVGARQAQMERTALNQAANQLFTEHAFTGVGLGAFPQALLRTHPGFPFYFQPPHNILLEAAAETGILGGISVTLLMTTPWIILWSNRSRLHSSVSLIGLSAVLVAWLIIGWMDYYPWLNPGGRFYMILTYAFWSSTYLVDLKRGGND